MSLPTRIGSWITVSHPTVVDVMCDIEQFQWLCVDLEHSPNSRLDLQTAVSIIQGRNKKAFVRVNENRHASIKFALDSGVDGIIIPMVNSAAEAAEAVSHCFYPPKGKRGVGLARAQKYGFGFEEHLQKNLNELEVFLQIEHIDAVNEIDQILATEGISGIFLGPYDLSGSMGIAGQFDHPDMISAITKVAGATKKSGLYLGIHVIPPCEKELKKFMDQSYNFLAFSIDTYFLSQKIRDEISAL
jgi:2-keto-3-deoxy-L-rhamnonate aldolase RhmA